jgi:hypothetical protein
LEIAGLGSGTDFSFCSERAYMGGSLCVDNFNTISLICAMVASLAAMFAAFMNYFQSRHAKKTYQAEIFLKFSERYDSAPM